MSLLVLGGYTPDEEPTAYEVKQEDTYAVEAEMDDGTTYVERSRSGIYTLSVGYTNITHSTLDALLQAISELVVHTQFYFGEIVRADMRVKSKDISLASLIGGEGRWNLSFDLQEY